MSSTLSIMQMGERISELEEKLEACKFAMAMSEKLEKQFKKQIAELNEKNEKLQKEVKDLEWQLNEVAKDNDYYQGANKRLEEEKSQLEKLLKEAIAICGITFQVKESDGNWYDVEPVPFVPLLNINSDFRIKPIKGYKLSEKRIEELEQENGKLKVQIKKMRELINRYYMVCAEIPKELRTMVFDSCMEDTREMVMELKEAEQFLKEVTNDFLYNQRKGL